MIKETKDISYFEFTHFKLIQSESSMKVSTDSRLLAAYARRLFYSHVLDIGCGIGIISFILAHANPKSKVMGIDISEKAIYLAQHSLRINPHINNIEFIHSDLRNIGKDITFDLVVSNPPYFVNQLASSNQNRNLFRHGDKQFIEDFCKKVSNIISNNANICIIIPPNLEPEWTYYLSMYGLMLIEQFYFKHTETADSSLVICNYSNKIKPLKLSTMQLMNSEKNYSTAMQEWLGDY